MTIRGTALRPGLSAPKIEKHYNVVNLQRHPEFWVKGDAYTENNNKQEINICYVVKLEPNVLWYEGQGRILCSPDLVSRVIGQGVAIFIAFGFGNRNIEVDSSISRLVGASHRVIVRARSTARARLSFFISHTQSLVEAIHDRDTFPHASGATDSSCRPSLPLRRFRDVTGHLLNLTWRLVGLPAEMY